MKDNEIKKALECLMHDNCEDCPYYRDDCVDRIKDPIELSKNALDLINRQQAEIDEMKHEREVLIEDIHHSADKINEQLEEIERLTERVHFLCGKSGALQGEIHKYQKEIVRLEYENEILSKNADTAFQDGLNEAQDLYAEQVKDEIKSEAIKEFADRLKESAFKTRMLYSSIVYELEEDVIDNLVKEMVGEK